MPRTEELPAMEGEGVALKRIKKLDDAIDEWNSIKTKRMALTEKEIEAKAVVAQVMANAGVDKYPYDDDHEVVLVEMVKSRKIEKDWEGEE